MWTDEYDRADDGLYLHDIGMPLEVWLGELLGPDPVEKLSKVVEAAVKVSKLEDLPEWQEKTVYWHKDAEGWYQETNVYHPEWVKKQKAKALAHAMMEQLYAESEKDLTDIVKEDAELNHEE